MTLGPGGALMQPEGSCPGGSDLLLVKCISSDFLGSNVIPSVVPQSRISSDEMVDFTGDA